MTRSASRLLLVGMTCAAALAVTALPASAHVTVQPGTATQGGFTAINFRVPTERPDASTVKLEVTFPAEQPLAFVSVRPHPGWTYKVEKTKLAQPVKVEDTEITETVSKITWTADSPRTAIKPGEFDEFSVSVGRLPESDQMVFKALQSYSSGEVVRWIEQVAEGAAEPERPAPILKLTPASNTGSVTLTGSTAATQADDRPSRAAVNAALGLGGAGLLVGLVSGGIAVLALRRRRT